VSPTHDDSGYIVSPTHDDSGYIVSPTHDDSGYIVSPTLNPSGTCGNGWVCEHHWRQIFNMVEFRNVVAGI